MISDDETAEFDGAKCIAETAKAILVCVAGNQAWIPKSMLHDDSEVYRDGDEGKLVVKLWWTEKAVLFE